MGPVDDEEEGVCLARVDSQRGNGNVEYTTVVGYLPRKVAVLQGIKFQRPRPGG